MFRPLSCPFCADIIFEGGEAGYAFVRSAALLHLKKCREREKVDVEEIFAIVDEMAERATSGRITE